MTRPARRGGPFALALAIACGVGTSACSVRESYLVERPALQALAAVPTPDRASFVLPAVRAKENKPAWVRASALTIVPTSEELAAGSGPVTVKTSVPSRMVTAGAVLTLLGSVCSIVGTAGWLATRNDAGPVPTALLAVELAGEAQMLTGTVLWIYGLTRRPQEVRAGQTGYTALGQDGALLKW